jgi:hypothetical protein
MIGATMGLHAQPIAKSCGLGELAMMLCERKFAWISAKGMRE